MEKNVSKRLKFLFGIEVYFELPFKMVKESMLDL